VITLYTPFSLALFFPQIRGVLRVQGCFQRAVFLWKSPNIIDFHFNATAANFTFESTASCVQQSVEELQLVKNQSASDSDLQTFEHVCKTFRFDVVSIGSSVLMMMMLSC
jgi:hypothetical protein